MMTDSKVLMIEQGDIQVNNSELCEINVRAEVDTRRTRYPIQVDIHRSRGLGRGRP